jgi:diadenosine tetraphosphate (Ap4A) HIT family hydrolase
METCFICRKHKGQEAAPPGGYIYDDKHWRVCHAPVNMGPLGTLMVEAKRHFLDYADMTDEEAESYGRILRKVYKAAHEYVDAERIYHVVTLEGEPHLHAWFLPRGKDVPERGLNLWQKDISCTEEDAIALAETLRNVMR